MLVHIIIYIAVFLFIPISATANTTNESIKTLMDKCEKSRSLSQYDSLSIYSSQLISEAKSNEDKRSETYGYFYNGLANLFSGKVEESQKMHDKAEDMAIKIGNDSVLALVMNARGIYHALMQNNNFVAQQFFFKSLDLARKAGYEDLSYRVRGNLLTLSHSMEDSISCRIADEVYKYGIATKNNEQIAMGSYYLATYHYTQKDYNKAEKYINIAIDTYNKYPYEDIASVYLLYSKIFINRGEIAKAEETVKHSLTLAEKYHQLSAEVEGYITYSEVLNKQKNYKEAIRIIKVAMEHADSIGMTSKKIDCNQLMAENYIAMNMTPEALKCLQDANSLLKEQATINMERLSHEQQIMRDIEQKEMEGKIRQEQIVAQRYTMILLSLIVVVLCILLVVIYYNYRKRQTLYKSIVQQNARSIARQMELQEQIDYMYKEKESKKEEGATPVAEAGIKKDKVDGLYAELCRLMETEHLYKEAQLTREKMAERLGTNRTYLIKIIKDKTNMNYLQFVNSYRINEAIKILSDKEKVNYPLKQIWSDLGFSSPSTFFKLFQQTVGITPSTYRKQFLEVNNETAKIVDEDENII